MTFERNTVEAATPRLRNRPLRPREWDELIERDDVTSVSLEEGTLALVPTHGQLCLYFAFLGEEEGRTHFAELFNELADDIADDGWPYTRIDLVEMMNRIWIEPLLQDAEFRPHGEWMEFERRELREDMPPPEIPEGYRMRRATEADHEQIVELEAAAYGDDARGEEATRISLQQANWTGVLEQDGRVCGYAINATAERGVGRIVSLAVDPDDWGQGLGRVLAEAAAYQVASQGATRATVEINPEVGPAIRALRAAEFRPGRRGVEWRRVTDAAAREQIRESERRAGVKARFGQWR